MHTYIFSLLILLIPTQLGLHIWPDWALVLGRRVDYISPTLFFTDILIGLLLMTWVYEVWSRRKNEQIIRKNTESKLPYYIYISVFVIFAITNIFWANNIFVAGYTWIKCIECVLLGAYIVKTKPNVLLVVRLLSIAVLYSSILALWQFVQQSSAGGLFWLLGERTFDVTSAGIARVSFCLPFVSGCPLIMRPYATFPHPNVLGGFLAAMLPLLIAYYDSEKVARSRLWLRRISICVGVIALVLTFSRSAWIVGGFAVALVLVKGKKPFGMLQGMGTVLIACLVALTVVSFNAQDESVTVRQQLHHSAVNIWRSSPLVGVGLGNFLPTLPDFLPSRLIYFLQPVHNIYLLLISEVGIIGYMLLAWFVWIAMRLLKPVLDYPIIVSICALALLGLVDHYLLTLQQGRLLLVLTMALSVLPRPR